MCCCCVISGKMWRMFRVEPKKVRTDWNSNDGAEQMLLKCVWALQVTSSWVSRLRIHHFRVLHLRSANSGSTLLAALLWTDASILSHTEHQIQIFQTDVQLTVLRWSFGPHAVFFSVHAHCQRYTCSHQKHQTGSGIDSLRPEWLKWAGRWILDRAEMSEALHSRVGLHLQTLLTSEFSEVFISRHVQISTKEK